MFEFIARNLANIIIGAVVLGILAAVTVKLIKDKKNHKTSCSCGCCSGSDKCPK